MIHSNTLQIVLRRSLISYCAVLLKARPYCVSSYHVDNCCSPTGGRGVAARARGTRHIDLIKIGVSSYSYSYGEPLEWLQSVMLWMKRNQSWDGPVWLETLSWCPGMMSYQIKVSYMDGAAPRAQREKASRASACRGPGSRCPLLQPPSLQPSTLGGATQSQLARQTVRMKGTSSYVYGAPAADPLGRV